MENLNEFILKSADFIFPFLVLLIFVLNILVLTAKKQILRAFDKYLANETILKKDMTYFSMSIIDIVYFLTPLPSKKSNPKFYDIYFISKKRNEYFGYLKGLLAMIILIVVFALIISIIG